MSKSTRSEMSFLDHLEELRWHLFRAFISVFVFSVIAFVYKDVVFDYIILAPSSPDFFTNQLLCQWADFFDIKTLCINQKILSFQNTSMAGQFTTHIWVSFVLGIILAFPYVFWEIWSFVKPALRTNELKYSRGILFFTSSLFIIGVTFAYYIILPLSIDFLGTYQVSQRVENIINISSYISTFSSIILAGGMIFELPILIYFLSKIGLVTSDFLKKYRKHSIIINLVIAAVITPPDVVSQILVAFPMIFLYEIGIIIAKRLEKARRKEALK